MTIQVLKISARELDQKINYINPVKQINLNNKVEETDFLIESIQKEVKQLTHQQKKKYVKILKSTLMTATSFFMLVNPILAAPVTPPSPELIMPIDIIKFGAWVIGILVALSTIMAMILYQLAGGMRMLRKRKEATEWTTDIIKGYFQILLAPIVIFSIVMVCYLLFGNFEWFISPF